MNKAILSFALASTFLAAPALAREGTPYVELSGGITAPNDSDYDSVADPDIVGTVEWGSGIDLGASAGYDFGMIRAEAEVAYKDHGFDRIVSGPDVIEDSSDLDFDFTTWSAMVNALVDFGPDDGIQGFVGGGIGIAGTELDLRDNREGNFDSDNDSDTTFAWQLLAGVRTPVTENLDVGLKYRYFRQDGLEFIVSDSDDFNTDFSSHSVLLSLTYNFGD